MNQTDPKVIESITQLLTMRLTEETTHKSIREDGFSIKAVAGG